MPNAAGSSDNSASRIAPEPVPRSAMRSARSRATTASAASTTVSVSGRGTSTSAVTASGRLQNSLPPRMRATGSWASRRPSTASSFSVSPRMSRCVDAAVSAPWSRPSAWPTSSRASRSGVSKPRLRNRSAIARRACATVSGGVRTLPSAVALMVFSWPCADLGVAFRIALAAVLRRKQRRLMFGGQGVDELAQRLALDHLRQLVEREVDAMVGDAPLRKIVGADALGAVARPDLAAPIGGALGVALLPLGVVEPGAQGRHRLRPVAVLRALLLHHDRDAGRDVRHAHRGLGLVDVLAAGAAGAHG